MFIQSSSTCNTNEIRSIQKWSFQTANKKLHYGNTSHWINARVAIARGFTDSGFIFSIWRLGSESDKVGRVAFLLLTWLGPFLSDSAMVQTD